MRIAECETGRPMDKQRRAREIAGARRSFVMKGNVAGPSAIGLHGASKLLGGCSTSLDQLLHPPSYTSFQETAISRQRLAFSKEL